MKMKENKKEMKEMKREDEEESKGGNFKSWVENKLVGNEWEEERVVVVVVGSIRHKLTFYIYGFFMSMREVMMVYGSIYEENSSCASNQQLTQETQTLPATNTNSQA